MSIRRAFAFEPRFHGPAIFATGGSGSRSVPAMKPTPELSLNDHIAAIQPWSSKP
jgi:hypothetical protein